MSEKPTITGIKIPKQTQRRLAKVAKLKSPKTSANALGNHYIETGLAADEKPDRVVDVRGMLVAQGAEPTAQDFADKRRAGK